MEPTEGSVEPTELTEAKEPIGSAEFETIVEEALALIPDRFHDAMENIIIVVEDEPTDHHYDALDSPDSYGGSFCDDELLGLYDGVSLPDRVDGYDLDVPDVITIFQGPHVRSFDTHEEMVQEVEKTVIHEIGHYFGLDDQRLAELGY